MPGHLARGHRVGGRYRLEAELGQGTAASAWRAFDERLERPVAVRLFDPELDRDLLQERAGRAASLTHPRVVRIFDTGFDGGQFFTVSELLPGSLAWARLPLPGHEAADIAVQIAEALHHAHDRGVAHGDLHPGNVLLSEQGAKVADFCMSGPALAHGADPAGDLAAFGRLLYRLCTGHDPGEAGGQPFPTKPEGLSSIVFGLMDGVYDSPARALADLRRLGPEPEPGLRRVPRGILLAAGALVVVLAVLGATRLGGRTPATPGPPPEGRITGTPLAVTGVTDFDPPPGDGREGRQTLQNATDADPQTFWSTERYQSSADLSGLKPGVGLVLDLGSQTEVGKSQILFVVPGCAYELRAADRPAATVEGWELVATVDDAPPTSPLVFRGVDARYWLLWITRLTEGVPGASGGFACAVAEAELYAP
jgi:serine/threonine protein kinase